MDGKIKMKKFKKKYRIGSTRLQHWDYGANALYFVTICCQDRVCWLGDVKNDIMVLSEIGEMAEKYWLEIPEHFPFVVLHNHIIMPNLVHGIIEIAKMDNANNGDDTITVETQNFASLPPPSPPKTNSDPNPKIWHPSFGVLKLG